MESEAVAHPTPPFQSSGPAEPAAPVVPEPAPTEASPGVDESPSPAAAPPPKIGRAGWVILGIVVAFSAFYFVLSYLRFSEFYGANWDLGVNMQALWTNTHGSLLYVNDLSRATGGGSFLLVHTTYIAIPVSWMYALAPSAETLFALQAVVVASSAIPLYLIGKRAAIPPSLLYVGIVVYLGSFPVISALLFDFHWEAFVSVEFLWAFYLIDASRYRLALVPAILGALTLEVFPFLVAGIGLYFVIPFIQEYLANHKLSPSSRRAFLYLLALVATALILFAVLAYVRENTIPAITGSHLVLTKVNPYTTVALGITWWAGVGPIGFFNRLLYWFLLVSAFGLVPLFYRQRLLILSIPWFAYTVFMTPNPVFTLFGYQYDFIAAAPLAVSFISGLGDFGAQLRGSPASRIPLPGWLLLLLPALVSGWWYSRTWIYQKDNSLWVAFIAACIVAVVYLGIWLARRLSASSHRAWVASVRRALRSPTTLRATAVVAVGALLAFNVAMSPLNTANVAPGLGNGYSFYYGESPSFQYMPGIVANIEPGETVLASDNLFPFVANNNLAYSLLWFAPGTEVLPFNATHLPMYVLLSTYEWAETPPFLVADLFNEGVYGMRDVVYSSYSYPGSIYLFQLGYQGPTDVEEATPYPTSMILCGHDFAIGPSGVIQPYAESPCNSIVQSSPAANLSGQGSVIWYGPYATLLAGNYTVTIALRGQPSAPAPASDPVVWMDANAVGTGFWYKLQVKADQLSPTQWTDLVFHFSLNESHPHAEWRGYVSGEKVAGTYVPGFVQLEYIEVDYSPAPNL